LKKRKNIHISDFKGFFVKIILPSFLSVSLFILTIFFIIIPHFKENIMSGKREMIKELTNAAWSILAKYESDETKGLMTREEAQKTAISRIQYLRYGEENKDYFWITDMHPTMIIHPYRPDLNGKDLTNFSDPHGKKLFVEFVKTVNASGHGYVDYMWQWKDDSLHIVPKLSYVKLFKPWGWIIGTGVYIEDVKREIDRLTKKLLWITIGITFLIGLLLLFISQQSLKIEEKRIRAENELNESKEKYRTLVEAATEGLIMLIDGKISFFNRVISQMTGYESAEIVDLSFNNIISESNNKETIRVFSENIIKDGQYEINLKKKTGGFVETLVTSSTALFYGKSVNIIMVKDITIDRNPAVSQIDYQKLVNTLNVGLFRATIDNKGKFISANETAINILGYENLKELSDTYILEILADADDRKNLRNVISRDGFIKNRILKINRKNNEIAYVSVSLVAFNAEDAKNLVCDGIIEDVTVHQNERLEISKLVAELKSSNFLIEQTIRNYITPLNAINADSPLNEAIRLLEKWNTDNLLVFKSNKDYIGIITGSDIQKRILALELKLDNPVYLIMSSPVVYISENTSVFEAIRISEERKINHLVVRNEIGEISGTIKTSDLYKLTGNSLFIIQKDIAKAQTVTELKICYQKLVHFIKPLINSEISVSHICSITSSVSDSLIKRLVGLMIEEIGEPPAKFSFFCLGSEGRKEETLFTDQDNAIIYEDVPREMELKVQEYFKNLGELVCNALNYIGYAFCKGNIMAKNQQWCQPVSAWERYFANWISTPEPQNLLDAMIFFDFRNICGEESFIELLREKVNGFIKNNNVFLYHLAYNTSKAKPQQISSGNILSDKNADMVDLKAAIAPIIMFARTYSLQNNIFLANTTDRLNAIRKMNLISENTADEIVLVYNYLMKMRFRNQVNLLDNNIPLSNMLNTKKMLEVELSSLKRILSLIPAYQNKISTDFRIST
jgi:PAS domain S-box-containing protein